jgi:hypothetical protein
MNLSDWTFSCLVFVQASQPYFCVIFSAFVQLAKIDPSVSIQACETGSCVVTPSSVSIRLIVQNFIHLAKVSIATGEWRKWYSNKHDHILKCYWINLVCIFDPFGGGRPEMSWVLYPCCVCGGSSFHSLAWLIERSKLLLLSLSIGSQRNTCLLWFGLCW